MTKIAIIGSTGVIGQHLVPKFLANNHILHLINPRFPGSQDKNSRIHHFHGNILQADTLLPGLRGCDLVINLATAIPVMPGQDWESNDKIRRDGTLNLINACRRSGIKRIIQQSVAMLYKTTDHEWANENSAFFPNTITQSAADMENLIKETDLDWLILRGGLLYGPRTGREATWRKRVQAGELELPMNNQAFISLIHIEDFTTAFVLAAKSNIKQMDFNVVDDEPVTYQDLYNFIALQEGLPHLNHSEVEAPFAFRVKNKLIKEKMRWQSYFSNYRLGLHR